LSRTSALPSWLARRIIRSYWAGSVAGRCITTGRVSSVRPALGGWPSWPAPNKAFCPATDCWMSVVVMPRAAMRSGFIQMRIAWSGTPMMAACPAPGTRLMASST
jgi:hypothetical protein